MDGDMGDMLNARRKMVLPLGAVPEGGVHLCTLGDHVSGESQRKAVKRKDGDGASGASAALAALAGSWLKTGCGVKSPALRKRKAEMCASWVLNDLEDWQTTSRAFQKELKSKSLRLVEKDDMLHVVADE